MDELLVENRFEFLLDPLVKTYVHAAVSDSTRRAYRSDLRHFLDWGGTIPASDGVLAEYLARHAGTLSVATLARRVASISKAHTAKGLRNPVQSELVRSTLRGIRRAHGAPQRRAKPLTKEDLFSVLAATGDDLKDVRDRALLLIGFAGAFRRSELVAIDCTDIEPVKQGVVISIRHSKTDQEGAGREIGIPHGRTRWCPVTALNDWVERAEIEEGPVFRPVDRHGRMQGQRLCVPFERPSVILYDRWYYKWESNHGIGFLSMALWALGHPDEPEETLLEVLKDVHQERGALIISIDDAEVIIYDNSSYDHIELQHKLRAIRSRIKAREKRQQQENQIDDIPI